MEDQDKIISKIKKCLALSKSSNPHEAAIALGQAEKMMQLYNIEHEDIAAAELTEARAKSKSGENPPMWDVALFGAVQQAFGVSGVYLPQGYGRSEKAFIGHSVAVEIAKYAYEVLYRKMLRARKQYIAEELSRFSTYNKTRHADTYCLGWVHSATAALSKIQLSDEFKASAQRYMAKRFGDLVPTEVVNRNKLGGRLTDLNRGFADGKEAELNHGVGGVEGRAGIGNTNTLLLT
jgi:hypothetical protein